MKHRMKNGKVKKKIIKKKNMKSLLIFALFAFLAVANCSDFLFCNYTATGCSSSDVQFCNFGYFGSCTPATTGEYFMVTGNATTGGNVLFYSSFCKAPPIQNITWSSFGACVAQGSSSYQVTKSNASPIFVHVAVILLSIFVLLGLFLWETQALLFQINIFVKKILLLLYFCCDDEDFITNQLLFIF